jgi:hypothetical protein
MVDIEKRIQQSTTFVEELFIKMSLKKTKGVEIHDPYFLRLKL